jgi:hypothetical protein
MSRGVSPLFKAAFFRAWKSAAREADIRRNDNTAYKAVTVIDKGVDTAARLVFWLQLTVVLLIILIGVGVANLFA